MLNAQPCFLDICCGEVLPPCYSRSYSQSFFYTAQNCSLNPLQWGYARTISSVTIKFFQLIERKELGYVLHIGKNLDIFLQI